jgi:hypothetical protein
MRYSQRLSTSLSFVFAGVMTGLFASCVNSSGPVGAPHLIYTPTVSAVRVTLAQPTLAPGQSTQATVLATSSDGNPVTGPIEFTSENPSVATVSSRAVVTAMAAGVAVIQASMTGHTGTASILVTTLSSPANVGPGVVVELDSTTIFVGHTTQASATIRDSAGNIVTGKSATWSSLSPSIATVSASGVITAVAAGAVTIQATISGTPGSTSLAVVDLASHNFEDGTWGPYVHFEPTDEDIVNDPTGAGRGKVARFHYAGTSQDRNRFLQYSHALKPGAPMFFRGEFYLDVVDMHNGLWGRKLVYYQPHEDYVKYGGANTPTFYSIIGLQGDALWVDNGNVPQNGPVVDNQQIIFTSLAPRTWYTLESELAPETSLGAGNGVMRIWLDGALIYEATDLKWSDPVWVGQPLNGTPLSPDDVYFERVEVGSQVNLNAGSYDEYRYWDNVAFSTKRIGH